MPNPNTDHSNGQVRNPIFGFLKDTERHRRLTHTERWLACILYDFRNPDTGLCCPSLETLAERCSSDKSYVSLCIKALVREGIILSVSGHNHRSYTLKTYDHAVLNTVSCSFEQQNSVYHAVLNNATQSFEERNLTTNERTTPPTHRCTSVGGGCLSSSREDHPLPTSRRRSSRPATAEAVRRQSIIDSLISSGMNAAASFYDRNGTELSEDAITALNENRRSLERQFSSSDEINSRMSRIAGAYVNSPQRVEDYMRNREVSSTTNNQPAWVTRRLPRREGDR